MISRPCTILIFGIVILGILIAGTTGKIAGRVTDRSDKGMQGVNVYLQETGLGVATDDNGYFTIINIPPGEYSIIASMIGYTKVNKENVKVLMNQTTMVNFRLEQTALEMSGVTVEAERPVIVPDISASQMDIQSDELERLPIADITEAIGLQAGIEGMTIRGGNSRQTAFFVDGFLLNDERANDPYTSISMNSIQEVQVQTGGFNAEYGNIRSGVVNVITREGSRSSYHGGLTYRYNPPAPKHFGTSVYDKDSYFLRPYLDPAVCWTGTNQGEPYQDSNLNGRWDEGEPFSDFNDDGELTEWDNYTQRQYPDFEGWYAIADGTTKDNDPTNDLTPTQAQQLFRWQHRRNGVIRDPDYTLDFSLGGPVPFLSQLLGNLRFQFSQKTEKEMFIFPLSRDNYFDQVSDLKVSSDISDKLELTLIGRYGENHSVSPYTWTTTPTGDVLRSTYSVANLTNSSSGDAMLFMPGYYSPASVYRYVYGVKLNHFISEKSFHEFILQRFENRYDTYQIRQRDTSKVNEVFPYYFEDEAPYGYWGYGVSSIDGMIMGGWMNLGRDSTKNYTTSIRYDLTNQINFRHQIKTGFMLATNEYHVRSSTQNPKSTWARSLVYDVFPYRFAGYLQDKIEYEQFIANVGLRLEYVSANSETYILNNFSEYYSQGLGHLIEDSVSTEPSEAHLTLNPRLGIAHPITEKSKLYFNYGHFQTEPASSYRFRIQRESNGLVTHIGNPNLKPERTIAYEVGYSHSYRNAFVLNVAAYYKDISQQSGWVYYKNVNSSVQYRKADNNNYADIRGIEFTLRKIRGTWFTGFVNYTYMVSTSGYFGLTEYYEDPNEMRDYLNRNPYQERPHPQPYLRVNLDFRTPANFGLVFAGLRPLQRWNLNVLGTYRTGSYATYNPYDKPGVVDNVQWRDRYNIDLRFGRTIQIDQYRFELFVDVFNALNTKFLSYAGFADNYDYLDYMESLHFDWEEGVEKGTDRIGTYRESDVNFTPMHWISTLDGISQPSERPLYWLTDEQGNVTYYQWENREWVERSATWVQKNVLDPNAYVDMPNIKAFTFLDPRKIVMGIQLNF